MSGAGQAALREPQEAPSTEHRAPRFADLPDVLTIADVLAALQISRRSYFRMVRHSVFVPPIEYLPGVRYAKSAVEAWVNRQPVVAAARRPALVSRRG